MNSHLKTIVIWLVVIAAVVIGYKIFDTASAQRSELDQSDLYQAVKAGDVSEVTITGDDFGFEIRGRFKTPRQGPAGRPLEHFTSYVVKDEDLVKTLQSQGVVVKVEKPQDNSFLAMILTRAPPASSSGG